MIHVGPLRVEEGLAERTLILLNSDEGVQGAISFLRQQGESKIGTIRVLVAVGAFSLGEAKRLVHCSETWRDQQDADETLHRSLEEVLRTVETSGATSAVLLPKAG